MMLVEESQIAEGDLPIAVLKSHLRLGTGFAEEDVQDSVLASFLRAALAAIEARTGKAMLTRGFVLTLHGWRDEAALMMPIAPVIAVTEFSIIDRFGATTVIPSQSYRLEQDALVPKLVAHGTALPAIPEGGSAELRFVAGFGASFDIIPADLAQAVLLLAAHYYEYRHETGLSQGCMPFGVTSLIARYRNVRVGFGS